MKIPLFSFSKWTDKLSPHLLGGLIFLLPFHATSQKFFDINPTYLIFGLEALLIIVLFLQINSNNPNAEKRKSNPLLNICVALFICGATAGLLTGSMTKRDIGIFLAYFLVPSILGLVGFYALDKQVFKKIQVWIFALFGVNGILALIQYHTLAFLPPEWWGNALEPKRAIGIFSHPNTLSLALVPWLIAMLPTLQENLQKFKEKKFLVTSLTVSWLLGVISIYLSLSRAGWLALLLGMIVFAIYKLTWKTNLALTITALVVGFVVLSSQPIITHRIRTSLFGDTSGQARFALWQGGLKLAQKNPFLGLGPNGFASNYESLQIEPRFGTHTGPHNLFLHLWIESGIVGLFALSSLLFFSLYQGLVKRSIDFLPLGLFGLAFLIQGMFDIAYFKNDLAVYFWLTLSFLWPFRSLSNHKI